MDTGITANGRHRATPGRERAALLCAVLLCWPSLLSAQSVRWGVRAGVVVSTALARDQVANPRLAASLGAATGPVRAVPAPAFQIEGSGSLPLRPRTRLELAFGWAFSRVDAKDDAGTRELQDMGAGHATVSVRYGMMPRLDAACGFGVIRYFAEERALFAAGTELSPLLECATRVTYAGWAGRQVFLRVAGQMHRFRTPLLADAGAQAGSVFRLALQAGIELGGER